MNYASLWTTLVIGLGILVDLKWWLERFRLKSAKWADFPEALRTSDGAHCSALNVYVLEKHQAESPAVCQRARRDCSLSLHTPKT
jgi:hypothetical protein